MHGIGNYVIRGEFGLEGSFCEEVSWNSSLPSLPPCKPGDFSMRPTVHKVNLASAPFRDIRNPTELFCVVLTL